MEEIKEFGGFWLYPSGFHGILYITKIDNGS